MSGRKSQHVGKLFEKTFKAACEQVRMPCTRMHDGGRRVGKLFIPVATFWDFVITHKGKTALIDTKTTADAGFWFSEIKKHQAEEMWKHETAGTVAGYVVWIRETSEVVFIPSRLLIVALGKKGKFVSSDPGVVRIGDLRLIEGTESDVEGRIVFSKIFRETK